ncbi:ATP-binding protein [Saccharopolyspora sp. NPDC000995]
MNNRGKQLGRRGLLVSGASGTGKSTSITQLGKKFQIETERRTPGVRDRIPVVYIVCPADATPKMLATEMAIFLGLPVAERDSPQSVAHSVAAAAPAAQARHADRAGALPARPHRWHDRQPRPAHP